MSHADQVTQDGQHFKLCEGLALIPVDSGFLVEGGARRQRFSGKSAAVLLDTVLPILRDSCTAETLAVRSGLPHSVVTGMVAQLRRRGLLEEAAGSEFAAARGLDAEVRAYLSRNLESLPGYRSVGRIASALSRCAVVHVGLSAEADAICEDLRDSGVGHVVQARDAQTLSAATVRARDCERRLVLAPASTSISDLVVPEGFEILRYGRFADRLEIGPLFGRPGSACAACFAEGHRRLFAGAEGAGETSGPGSAVLAGLVVAQALGALVKLTETPAVGTLTVLGGGGGEARRYTHFAEPGCSRCSAMGGCTPRPGAAGERYEAQVARDLAQLQPSPHTASADLERNAATAARRPAFPTAPRHDLGHRDETPEPDGVVTAAWARHTGTVTAPWAGQDLESTLSGILLRVAGFREQGASSRWAPSGGNMASVELYLAAAHPFYGRQAGTLFRYDDVAHQVLVPHAGTVDLPTTLEDAGLASEGLVAVVFLVAAVKRLAEKYGRFSYHLAHLDAGCAITQLSAVATGYGWTIDLARRIGPDLAGFLELHSLELHSGGEVVTGLVGLYRTE
jgi:SagB-type dehydrogenase family enzyme